MYKLKDANYESYLVGGAVRDLLMGRRPKDFDLATDARPNDLRRLFRNSRVVGRRFRLVHVFFGQKNVEVATLRSMSEPADNADNLYVDDDNQWGDIESDAFRRDFTINSLFYDIRDFAIIDYTGGVQDLQDHLIRCIGDPQVRFREDPVRMLRAIKFAARFGYRIEDETDAAMRSLQGEIGNASHFRVTEEIFRIFSQPNRERGVRLLAEYGFFQAIYPEWVAAIGTEGMEQVCEYFAAVDAAAAEDIYFPLEVLTAGLFLPLLDTIDVQKDHFHRVASRITGEIRTLGIRMELPKRLILSAMDLLRGQLHLLYFAHLPRRVERFVQSPSFDSIWRVHLLAFSQVPELQDLQQVWRDARQRLNRALGGVVASPDKRDIYSFRGRPGGDRLPNGRGVGRERRGADRHTEADGDDWGMPADEADWDDGSGNGPVQERHRLDDMLEVGSANGSGEDDALDAAEEVADDLDSEPRETDAGLDDEEDDDRAAMQSADAGARAPSRPASPSRTSTALPRGPENGPEEVQLDQDLFPARPLRSATARPPHPAQPQPHARADGGAAAGDASP
jgi:poly(A) polymerase